MNDRGESLQIAVVLPFHCRVPKPGKKEAIAAITLWRAVIDQQELLTKDASKGSAYAAKRLTSLYALFANKRKYPSLPALRDWYKPRRSSAHDAFRVHFVHQWLTSAIENHGAPDPDPHGFDDEADRPFESLVAKQLGMDVIRLRERIGQYARHEVGYDGDGAVLAAAHLMEETTRFPSVRTILRRIAAHRAAEENARSPRASSPVSRR